ncbi:hypothetical protein AB5I41_09040 [Sphingomonas sp. MMS24-JH45]
MPVGFVFIGRSGNNDIYRADLSHIGVDINSIRLADSNSRMGGGTGVVSGFDVGAVALSKTFITEAMVTAANGKLDLDDPGILPRIDALEFAAEVNSLQPGTQRPSGDGIIGRQPVGRDQQRAGQRGRRATRPACFHERRRRHGCRAGRDHAGRRRLDRVRSQPDGVDEAAAPTSPKPGDRAKRCCPSSRCPPTEWRRPATFPPISARPAPPGTTRS